MGTSDMLYGPGGSTLPVRLVLAWWKCTGNPTLVSALCVLPSVHTLDDLNRNDARTAEQTQGPDGKRPPACNARNSF